MSEFPRTALSEALEPIYDEMSAELFPGVEPMFRKAVWRGPYCFEWSPLALGLAQTVLQNSGAEVEHIVCNPSKDAQIALDLPESYHHYLRATTPGGTQYVIDGTWQQFASPLRGYNLPKILIARSGQAGSLLHEAGVPEDEHYIWSPHRFPDGVYMTGAEDSRLPLTLTR